MSKESERTCPSCGNELSGAMEFCPVCLLREGLAGGVESGESSFEEAARPTAVQALQRFEHYELLRSEDGKPVELGRGAMGITYKAFDVNLRCPVTLKVISERYLGDESMRLRFLREARAAAKVRHANVASVFHLGRSSGDYFYAMEFVEGETLESLIQASLPGLRIVPNGEDVLTRCDVPTDRQVTLGRDRDMITPGQFFLCCGSSIATAHGGTIRSAELRGKSSRRTEAAQYPMQSAQELGSRSRI
jgi:hypothetical protein